MKCKNCMAELEEGTLFCPECGARVDNDSDKTVVLQEDLDAVEEAANEQPAGGHKIYEDPVRQGQADQAQQPVYEQPVSREEPVRQEEPVQEPVQESAPVGGGEEPGSVSVLTAATRLRAVPCSASSAATAWTVPRRNPKVMRRRRLLPERRNPGSR